MSVNCRPILFSGPMVRAILQGKKTQTRRIVKPQPLGEFLGPKTYHPSVTDRRGDMRPGPEQFGIFDTCGEWSIPCRYGRPGERLWVRETFCRSRNNTFYRCDGSNSEFKPNELSEEWDWGRGCGEKWTPSIHMNRHYSRITLEIAEIRVERLQDISGRDVLAEGIDNGRSNPTMGLRWENMQRMAWKEFLEKLGHMDWNGNPWVWVIEFARVEN